MPASRRSGPLVVLALTLAACAPVGSVATPEGHPASPMAPSASALVVAALPPVPQPNLPEPLRPDGDPPGEGAMGHDAMGHDANGQGQMDDDRMGHDAAAMDHAEAAGSAPMADALDAYLAIHDALASDQPAPAVAHGAHFAAAFAVLVETPLAGDPHFWHMRGEDTAAVRDAAARLVEAGGLAAARQAFGALSAPFLRLVEAAGVPEGYDLETYTCGMAEGVPEGGVWLQRPGDTRNPYLGGAMPTCGTQDGTLTPEQGVDPGADGRTDDGQGTHDTESPGHEGH